MSGASTRGRKPPRIRWSEEGDCPAMAEINRKAFEHAYSGICGREETEGMFASQLPRWSSWLKDRAETLGTLVAELGDEPVGIAGLVLLKDGDGELAALYVLPEHQGRGVGLGPWEASVAEFKGRGVRGCGSGFWLASTPPASTNGEAASSSRMENSAWEIAPSAPSATASSSDDLCVKC